MEIWRDIIIDAEDFTGYYQVSNLGRVRSVDRTIMRKNGRKQFWKGQIIKQHPDKDGYLRMELNKDGKIYPFFAHRLVAIIFIPNIENKLEVNHKDIIKENNNVNNLEWNTSKENKQHAVTNGVYIGRKMSKFKQGENHLNSKLTNKKVLEIRRLHLEGNTKKELAKQFGVSYITIYGIIKRLGWRHI